NSILALVTLPLVVNLALNHFGAGSDTVGIQPGKMIQVFAIVLVPVALGMLVRAKAPGFADRMDKPVRIASAILLALVVIGAILGEEKAVDYFLQVGLVTSLFCVTSLVVGYAVPRIAGLTVPQSIASGFEIGIHNSTLAIAVALTVLENTTMAIPSAIYGIVMFPIAAIFGFVLVRMVRPPADSTAKAA
ncbi:MAG TPA: bile acid:sodium symporter family protein, partial [Phycicoccus sp.]|nr:bile acid:sodium symporter family protein [Phycicoccus sp.]